MSLEATAALIAEHLARQEYVEVYGHNDADGIAAASILGIAILRAKGQFRLRITSGISTGEIRKDAVVLLCDFGSSLEGLPPDTVVIDHQHPVVTGKYHLNPQYHAVDGDSELSASGAAYLIAQHMGDNRDLAGLALLGVIGDRQELSGANLEIFNEAVAEGVISLIRGISLPGRDDHERLLMAINPYLHQVSGDEPAVADLLERSRDGGVSDQTALISLLLLEISPYATVEAMESVYGDRFGLEREVMDDAHSLTAVIDACGKSGYGGLAASLCFRSAEGLDEAWQQARHHRMKVIEAIRTITADKEFPGFYRVDDPVVSGDVADALAFDCIQEMPIAVFSRSGDLCHISARIPKGIGMDIGSVMRELAITCGGFGGGHKNRAGATVNCSEMDRFRTGLQEVFAE
jgi:single-stranded-DNA-specific exonuclease